MIKWMAFIFALVALSTSASHRDVDGIERRLIAIEGRKCLLMAVTTPTGTVSICANDQ